MNKFFDAECFEMLILDEDRRLFCIAGPMSNDTNINDRIRQGALAGRKIRYEGPLDHRKCREQNIEECRVRTGFIYAEDVFPIQ